MAAESAQALKGLGVAGWTLSGGILTFLNYIPPVLGVVATLSGIVLSIMLAWKAYNDIHGNRKLRKAQIADIKFRRDNDLPCRRCGE